MRPLRAIVPMLRKESPVTLAREAVWRAWKPYRSNRLLTTMRRGEAGLSFRSVPYYRPKLDEIDSSVVRVVLGVADLVCCGKFPFMGYLTADIGFPPQWNRDFVSGFEWENIPAARLQPVVRHNGSDVKVPWELSRLQFLPVLAKAYRLSKSEKYREAAKALLLDWINKNPVGVGVNWTMAMESALRGMSLCFMLSLLQPLRPEEQDWKRVVTRSIWEHLHYTEASLEFSHVLRSNHYLSNIVGLLCMSTFLEGADMERRRRVYQSQVQDEIFRQVYEDGGDYEASTGYHVLVLQMFTTAFLLMRAAGHEPRPEFRDRLIKMYQFLTAVANSDGCAAQIGDCDDGRTELLFDDLQQMLDVPPAKRDSLRVSGLLGVGNAMFRLECGGGSNDLPWYGLTAGRVRQCRPRLEIFPVSGFAVARHGDAEIIFCAFPNGIQGRGSHTHNDKLNLIARIGKDELFCDSGTFFYTRDVTVRNRFRETAAHNTVIIDDQEQNTINRDRQFAFCVGNEAQVGQINAEESLGEVSVGASHFGYRRLGVEHHRRVHVLTHSLIIEDCLRGEGEHVFEIRWHLSSIWSVSHGEQGFLIGGPRRVRLTALSPVPLSCMQASAEISRTYGGALDRGRVLSIRGITKFPCNVITRVTWE